MEKKCQFCDRKYAAKNMCEWHYNAYLKRKKIGACLDFNKQPLKEGKDHLISNVRFVEIYIELKDYAKDIMQC